MFEREAREFQSFHTFTCFNLRHAHKNITRIAHSYRKKITRKSTLEYKLDYEILNSRFALEQQVRKRSSIRHTKFSDSWNKVNDDRVYHNRIRSCFEYDLTCRVFRTAHGVRARSARILIYFSQTYSKYSLVSLITQN